jgi:hypothetical protein
VRREALSRSLDDHIIRERHRDLQLITLTLTSTRTRTTTKNITNKPWEERQEKSTVEVVSMSGKSRIRRMILEVSIKHGNVFRANGSISPVRQNYSGSTGVAICSFCAAGSTFRFVGLERFIARSPQEVVNLPGSVGEIQGFLPAIVPV